MASKHGSHRLVWLGLAGVVASALLGTSGLRVMPGRWGPPFRGGRG
jgi:hypothetical protein